MYNQSNILQILTENFAAEGGKQNTRFVFPTQTAAFFWAQKVLSVFDLKTLAMERFIAWDRFKESCIRTEIEGLKPANAVHRDIFAVNLAERNAKQQMFGALIPQKYSEDGTIFARNIARMLPLLRLWRENYERVRKTGFADGGAADAEDSDLLTLENEYKNFLASHNLFESAWERPPFKETENEYFIFYPELIEDFAEHESLLDSANIHTVRIGEDAKINPLTLFDSSRAEIRAAILEIRRLYEQEKIPYEDIAVSVPELETLEPYIKRDAALYDVPLHIRSGKPLTRYGAGSFFSHIKDVADNNFSFQSLKALLLDKHLPWRESEKNERLIRFGIENNCVSGYREGGVLKDVWEEALRMENSELHPYYRDIKRKIYNIVNAKSFEDIRKYYFVFRGDWEDGEGASLFLKSACSAESYDVMARCIEELSSLIRIQDMIPDIQISGVLSFYNDLLNERQYVPEREGGGVNVFQYRVAAAAPFAAHFVLNANQKSASVVYRGLKFLRPDKRKKLGLTEDDYDASPAFFRAYGAGLGPADGKYVRYSASSFTFSGWTMPHSLFNRDCVKPEPGRAGPDAYVEEKSWWTDPANPFPARLFRMQKESFNFWNSALIESSFNFVYAPFAAAEEHSGVIALLREAIREKKYRDDKLRVSASGLQSFYTCAVFWLFENIFEIEEESLEALLLDDISKGLLFHTILYNLYQRIKTEDKIFEARNIEKYRTWVKIYTEQAAAEYRAFRGPLCVPLISAMTRGIERHISELLETECKKFSGYSVSELEAEKTVEYADFILNGRLDRVSVSAEGGPCIVDYKVGKAPAKKDCMLTDDGRLTNFQIPVYIKLYEEAHGLPVEEAVFLSIVRHEAQIILDGGKMSRDAYQPVMETLEAYLEDYNKKIKALDFRKKDVEFLVCADCIYKKICRTTFSLNETRGQFYGA
ncbi:MAG: PD-(D/E)XK nuclease family protein [Spirochaetaceae bacterium]|jgi:hypothetical protein|nr:PD-(D/E)XK nuclease family protein [Spirochaetaceae bacterium]